MKTFISALLIIISLQAIRAQSPIDYIFSQELYDLDMSRIKLKSTISDTLKPIGRIVSLFIHIADYAPEIFTDISKSINDLNIYFAPAGLSFSLCGFDSINNPNYFAVTNGGSEHEILIKHYKPEIINIYVVNQLQLEGNDVCGYAPLISSDKTKDYIFVKKSCLQGLTLVHEMGHLLGLLHPHEDKLYGKEYVQRTNCYISGDLLCDTPAEPDLSGKVTDCSYTGTEKDEMGNFYIPSVANIMSSSPDECRCRFTYEQYTRITRLFYLKSYLR